MLELINEIISFLQIFTQLFKYFRNSVRILIKTCISGIFWGYKSKLQIIHATTYITLFLLDSNDYFFICLVPYPHLSLHLSFVFLFSPSFLFSSRHETHSTMFDPVSLQPARNIMKIRNTS